MNIARTGIDLIEVPRFEAQSPEIRRRFIERVFTPAERAYCGENAQHLAGRFACKEAVSKALGVGIGKIGWQDIEILNDENGRPCLCLHGEAAAEAERQGLKQWTVSITHVKSMAAASVVALGEADE